MNILWAPWRMTYIAGETGNTSPPDPPPGPPPVAPAPADAPAQAATGCIFCDKVAAGPASHPANLILWRGGHTFVIMNLYPYNSGHLMVVPYRHLADVTALTPDEYGELFATFQR